MHYRTEPLIQVASVIDSLHKTPKYDNSGAYSMVRATDIQYGVLELGSTYKVNTDVYNQFSKNYKPSKDDTLIVRVGVSYGRIALVGDINFCLGQNTAAIIPTISKRYIYYVLSSPYMKKQIDTYIVGAAQPTLSLKAIKALEIPRFGEKIENKIAHILSTLDDKIELNRKMNQTLEEMAQALFKSWFVDFDPVHANADAKSEEELEAAAAELGVAKEILELFPGEFEESELGMIPLGWEVKSIYDVANIIYGAPFSSKHFNGTQTGKPLIRIRDLKTFNSQHWTEEEHVKGTLITAGDLLIGMDAEFTPTIWQGIDGWLNQRVLKVVPLNGTYTVYHYFSLKPKMQFFEKANVGTTVIHLGKKDIDTIRLLVPSQEILEQSASILEPLFKQLVHNSIHNRSLQRTRDTLLPKLLSGELDVSEVKI